MRIPFYKRLSFAKICEIEIPNNTDDRWRVGVALEMAVKAGIDLSEADLSPAYREIAYLDGANLSPIRDDIYDILRQAVPEVPALLAALREGRVDGTTYWGKCACLCGTIANARGVDFANLEFKDAGRPAEQWFFNIRPGDTPVTSRVAEITEGWIVDFMASVGIPA